MCIYKNNLIGCQFNWMPIERARPTAYCDSGELENALHLECFSTAISTAKAIAVSDEVALYTEQRLC